jgi:magnesium and cobalt exporter, CNNM family
MSIGFEIIVIALLILGNGVFAMSEMAVISARKSRLQDWVERGHSRARAALELGQAPNQLLASVQFGITLIGILTGIFAGRGAAQWMAESVRDLPYIGLYREEVGLALVVFIITYFSLVVGELVPKRLAMRHPEAIATWVAVPLGVFTRLSAPMVHLLSVSTDLVCRLFGHIPSQEPPVTEEDIKNLVQQGAKAGIFQEEAEEMVQAVLHLGDKTARSLMTPRSLIAWLDLESGMDQIRAKIGASGRSRFPVAAGSLDKVTGIVQAKDLLALTLANKPIDLNALMLEPLFVPRTISALEVLETFKKTNKHIALVVDEYGGIEGLLTHHDILEAIAGDIPIGEKPADPKAVRRHDGSWLLDGMLSVEEFKEIFHVDTLPGEKRDAYQTLGGFVFTQMGRVPAVAESFEWRGFIFEIVDMDGKRIDKVLVMSKDAPGAVSAAPEIDSQPTPKTLTSSGD